MAEHTYTSLTSQCAISSVGWSGVKLTAIGLCSSGNAFSGVMNHASPSGSPTDESGFVRCQENMLPVRMHRDDCIVWWRRNIGLG